MGAKSRHWVVLLAVAVVAVVLGARVVGRRRVRPAVPVAVEPRPVVTAGPPTVPVVVVKPATSWLPLLALVLVVLAAIVLAVVVTRHDDDTVPPFMPDTRSTTGFYGLPPRTVRSGDRFVR